MRRFWLSQIKNVFVIFLILAESISANEAEKRENSPSEFRVIGWLIGHRDEV